MKIISYTDGSSRGNPGPGGWGAIVNTGDKVYELGGGNKKTTNNRMEMQAAAEVLNFIKDLRLPEDLDGVEIHTDSAYLINGITKWVQGWQRNGWMTKEKGEVLNKDLWQELVSLTEKTNARNGISWKKVSGHSGHDANERCDRIATSFADGERINLYKGPSVEYKIDFEKLGSGGTSSSKSGKAYLYISMVEGRVKRHKTWAECEERVKGVQGARFKKVFSESEARDLEEEFMNSGPRR